MVGQLTSTSFEDLEKFQILQTKKILISVSLARKRVEFSEEKSSI